jgi:hypothetical protein
MINSRSLEDLNPVVADKTRDFLALSLADFQAGRTLQG